MAVPLERFVQQLEDSGIIAGDTLKDFLPPKASPQNAEELALELVRHKKLTKFQAEEVSRGKGKSLVLGKYVVLEKIGAGGMGQVFKARHRVMERLVAVKVLPPAMTKDQAAISRFHREVQAAAKLNHPNIVTAFDADQADGVHFLVMEFIEGKDLSALVKKNGPFAVDQAVNFILQAARGLEAAHKNGIVHRDIKPANLLLHSEGTVKILDMGLARMNGDAAQAELTSTGAVMGTVDYMAPEQALNTKTADARADIYSLGCSLYYLLTAKATYDGDTLMAKLLAHRDQPIPSLRSVRAEVPKQIESVFRKMVAKDINARYQTMTEVISSLESCRSGPANHLPENSMSSRTLRASSSNELSIKSNASSTQQLSESLVEAAPTDFLDAISAVVKAPRKKRSAKGGSAKSKAARLKDQKKALLIGGGLLGVVVLLTVIILTMQGSDTKLMVTVNEPDAVIEVLNQEGKVEVTRKGDTSPIKISIQPGQHRIKVQKDGFELFTDSFEIKSGNTESISAKLVPLKKAVVPAASAVKFSDSPDFTNWMQTVAAMPVEKQVEAINQKLKELNPNSNPQDGSGPPVIRDGQVIECEIVTDNVSNLSPIRALHNLASLQLRSRTKLLSQPLDLSPINGLKIHKLVSVNQKLDLSTIKGLPLLELVCFGSANTDVTALSGMPLQLLFLSGNWELTNLQPLKGMRLTRFACDNSLVADLSPLSGMPLKSFTGHVTQVADLSPLRGMPLEVLSCEQTPVKDLSPLVNMKLQKLSFTPSPDLKGVEVIRQMSSLMEIGTAHDKLMPSSKFWKEYDEGRFHSASEPRPVTNLASPEFQKWMKDVQALRAEDQIEAVRKKLMELNPGFDGQLKNRWDNAPPPISNDAVTELRVVTDNITDISPIRALVGLKHLFVIGSALERGKLRDLSPLAGMTLTEFCCNSNPKLSDLSALKGMPLTLLNFLETQVTDLSALRGMPLENLWFAATDVSDLSPLKGMPLKHLLIWGTKVADLSPLTAMPLTELNIASTLVADLSPLKGMPLDHVVLNHTPVADLSPLRGAPLSYLTIDRSGVTDLSPLEGMTLSAFLFTPRNITKGINSIRRMKSLKTIGNHESDPFPADEFWKKYDAGEFGKPQ